MGEEPGTFYPMSVIKGREKWRELNCVWEGAAKVPVLGQTYAQKGEPGNEARFVGALYFD